MSPLSPHSAPLVSVTGKRQFACLCGTQGTTANSPSSISFSRSSLHPNERQSSVLGSCDQFPCLFFLSPRLIFRYHSLGGGEIDLQCKSQRNKGGARARNMPTRSRERTEKTGKGWLLEASSFFSVSTTFFPSDSALRGKSSAGNILFRDT